MASALSLVVLGQAYFFGVTPNVSSIATNAFQIPSINLPLIQTTPELYPEVRRDDYNYTPGIGAHKVHTKAVSWNAAWRICRNEGGNLAVINSLAESRLIKKLLKEAGPHTGGNNPQHAHIGFHDLFIKNEWVTVHGESLMEAGFNEWQDGEPNNVGKNERCGSVYVDGTLNDNDCNIKICGFICELPFVQSYTPPQDLQHSAPTSAPQLVDQDHEISAN